MSILSTSCNAEIKIKLQIGLGELLKKNCDSVGSVVANDNVREKLLSEPIKDENTINGEGLVDLDFVLSYSVKTGEISLHLSYKILAKRPHTK